VGHGADRREDTEAKLDGSSEAVLILNRRATRGRVEYRSGVPPGHGRDVRLGRRRERMAPGHAGKHHARGWSRGSAVKDVPVGDGMFDQRPRGSSSSEDFARTIVNEDCVRCFGPRRARGFVFRLTPTSFFCGWRHLSTTRIRSRSSSRREPPAFGLDLPERERVQLGEVKNAVSSEAQCEICGSKLSAGRVVRCAKCRTPHHSTAGVSTAGARRRVRLEGEGVAHGGLHRGLVVLLGIGASRSSSCS